MSPDMKAAVPILRSFDEAKAREFYIDFLGFEVLFEHRFDEGGPLYMGIKLGDCEIHLTEHFGDSSPGAGLRIEVDDVAAYIKGLQAKHYRHARPGGAALRDWGSADCTITDPFGNRLTFFSPAP